MRSWPNNWTQCFVIIHCAFSQLDLNNFLRSGIGFVFNPLVLVFVNFGYVIVRLLTLRNCGYRSVVRVSLRILQLEFFR